MKFNLQYSMKRYLLFFVFAIFSAQAVGAADPAPLSLLKSVSQQMIHTLDSHHRRISKDMPFLEKTIRKILVPHFTVTAMARSVVGRKFWESASAKERSQFVNEFTDMVIGVYAAPLSDYNGDKIQFYPMRNFSSKDSRVQVQSVIIRPTGQKISVSYRLVQTGNTWKVYDFSVEGISMVTSYRSQFKDILRQSGFAGLLRRVQSHNRKA